VIELRNVSRVFKSPSGETLTVLENLSCSFEAGLSVAIEGPSGSGKSTLLGLLAGLDQPTSGQVIVAGHDLGSLTEAGLSRFRAQNLGFIFQAFHLLQHFSALQNVVIAGEIAGLTSPLKAAQEALARVGLEHRTEHLPGQLSGGECQRVAIARAIVTGPKILLCDEPTGSLDRVNASKVFELLLALHKDLGTTLVLVTHDPHLADRLDRQVLLEGGRIANGAA
jgi:putative ABC transport system ATP-binding protein